MEFISEKSLHDNTKDLFPAQDIESSQRFSWIKFNQPEIAVTTVWHHPCVYWVTTAAAAADSYEIDCHQEKQEYFTAKRETERGSHL